MSRNVRPGDHEQRTSCNNAAALLVKKMGADGRGLPESVSATLRDLFLPASKRYVSGHSAHLRALSTRITAAREVREADLAFDSTGRAWNKSVLDSGGMLVPQQLERVMGVLPGRLFNLRPAREVLLAAQLFEQLPDLPHLRGDATRLANFMAAHATLAGKVTALQEAERVLRNSSRTLRTLTREFDKKWLALVNVLEEADPALAAEVLPSFPPRSHKPKPSSPKEPPVASPAGPADDEASDEMLCDELEEGGDLELPGTPTVDELPLPPVPPAAGPGD